MPRYLYIGPRTAVTIAKRETVFIPNTEVELDPSEAYFKRLIARGHLKRIPPAEPSAPLEAVTPDPRNSKKGENK